MDFLKQNGTHFVYKQQLDLILLQKSYSAAIGQCILLGLLLLGIREPFQDGILLYALSFLLVTTNIIRFVSTKRAQNLALTEGKTFFVLYGSIMVSACFWSALIVNILFKFNLGNTHTTVALLIAGGLGTSALQTLSSHPRLNLFFNFTLVFLPGVCIALVNHDRESLIVSGIFFSYFGFLLYQSRHQYKNLCALFREKKRNLVEKNRIQNILDSFPGILVHFDGQHHVLSANKGFTELQDSGKTNFLMSTLAAFKKTPSTSLGSKELALPALGNRRHFVSLRELNDLQNETILTTFDIEDWRRSEEESMRRNLFSFNYATEAILIVDGVNGDIVECNPKAESLFEESVKELRHLGLLHFYKKLQPQGDAARTFTENSTKAFEGQELLFERHIVTKSGKTKICEVRTRRFPFGKNGKLIRASFIDISERFRLENELKDALAKAEAASKTKAQFLRNMSHEIRTPMNGILGMASLLLGTVKDPAHSEILKVIYNCTYNLLELINGVLDFSKLEAGKVELEQHPFSLLDNILEAIYLFESKALEKGILISYNAAPNVPEWVIGDVTRFRQILFNLIGNAVKFTEKGRVSIHSQAKQTADNSLELEISVQDTGLGIPEELKGKLFQTFSQVDASTTRRFGGSGLGLAICKGLCEQMGGTIWVESKSGEGSTFKFTVRVQATDAPIETKSVKPLDVIDSELGKKNPLRILVAEDNQVNQLVIVGFLARLAYQATVVTNGLMAVEACENQTFDLILMDCHMPEMDGFEAAKKINVQFEARRPRIIALTASVMNEDIERCRAAGMDGFLAKPLTVQSLVQVLRESHSSAEKKFKPSVPLSVAPILSATFDRDSFSANFSGMEDLAQETILSFLTSLPKLLSEVEKALQTKNCAALELSSHTLKGALSTFFAEPTRELAWKLEQMGNTQSITDAEAVFQELKLHLDRLTKDLHNETKRKETA